MSGGHRTTGPLKDPECATLSLLGAGMTRNDIAADLGVADHTVKGYVRRAVLKMGAATSYEAVAVFATHVAYLDAAEAVAKAMDPTARDPMHQRLNGLLQILHDDLVRQAEGLLPR